MNSCNCITWSAGVTRVSCLKCSPPIIYGTEQMTQQMTLREKITATICEVFHPGANHSIPQITCTKASEAADAILVMITVELERQSKHEGIR